MRQTQHPSLLLSHQRVVVAIPSFAFATTSRGLTRPDAGQSTDVQGDENMLEQAESLDSDEVRNDDGDQVVDPPDRWIDSTDNTSLDDKLAAEVPDAVAAGAAETVPTEAHDSDQGGGLLVVSD